MSKRKTVKNQMHTKLASMTRFGESLKTAMIVEGKQNPSGIFSYKTYKDYINSCNRFADWLKENHPECRYVEDAKPFVKEYLQAKINEGLSAWTIHSYASAFAKLFECNSSDFGIELPKKIRKNITRSREAIPVSVINNNPEITAFCTGTGLSMKELMSVKPEDIYRMADGHMYIRVSKGKSGVSRNTVVLQEYEELITKKVKETNPKNKIFPKVPSDIDLQSFRRRYATLLYLRTARNIKDVSDRSELVYLKSEYRGLILDRKALEYVGKQLGVRKASNVASSSLELDTIKALFSEGALK